MCRGVDAAPLKQDVRQRLGKAEPMNIFAKLFVFANRLFGAFTLLIGVALLGLLGLRLLRGLPTSSNAWIFALIGIVLIAVGVVYLRAPLSRDAASRTMGN